MMIAVLFIVMVYITNAKSEFFTQGQVWPSGIVVACVCVSVSLVCLSLACPRDNLRPIQSRITKFGPKVQNTLVKVPIILWTDQTWPSRLNKT